MLLGKLERPGTKRKETACQMPPLRVKLPCSKYCEWPPQLCPTLPFLGVLPKRGMWLCRNLGTDGQQLSRYLRSSLRQCWRMTRMLCLPKNPWSNSISLHTCLRPWWPLGLAWENEIGICVQSGFTLSRVGSYHPGDSSGCDSSFALWT